MSCLKIIANNQIALWSKNVSTNRKFRKVGIRIPDYFTNNKMSVSRVCWHSFRTCTKALTSRRIIVRKLRHCWTESVSSIFDLRHWETSAVNLDSPPTSKTRICNSWRQAFLQAKLTFSSFITMKNYTIRRIICIKVKFI